VDDVTRVITLALEPPEPGYALLQVVRADSGRHWDLEAARRTFDWEPQHAFGEDRQPRATPPA